MHGMDSLFCIVFYFILLLSRFLGVKRYQLVFYAFSVQSLRDDCMTFCYPLLYSFSPGLYTNCTIETRESVCMSGVAAKRSFSLVGGPMSVQCRRVELTRPFPNRVICLVDDRLVTVPGPKLHKMQGRHDAIE